MLGSAAWRLAAGLLRCQGMAAAHSCLLQGLAPLLGRCRQELVAEAVVGGAHGQEHRAKCCGSALKAAAKAGCCPGALHAAPQQPRRLPEGVKLAAGAAAACTAWELWAEPLGHAVRQSERAVASAAWGPEFVYA